jgi:hypothetical protein
MAIQYSVTVRNAQLDQWETTIGTSPQLRLYSGSAPADCATAPTGTLLATLTLPSDWMGNASSGSKSKSGTWSGTGSVNGTAGYYRIYDSGGTTCHEQGTVGQGSGDLSLDNTSIASSQSITISTWTRSAANA